MFIDPVDTSSGALGRTDFYTVSPFARVRKEPFGLLFYNTRDTTLTFVGSGSLLQVVHSSEGSKLTADTCRKNDRAKIEKLIDRLLQKGCLIES